MTEATKVLRACVQGEQILATREEHLDRADASAAAEKESISGSEIHAASQQFVVVEERHGGLRVMDMTKEQTKMSAEDEAEQDDHKEVGSIDVAVHDAFTAASPAVVTAQNWSGAVSSSGTSILRMWNPINSPTTVIRTHCVGVKQRRSILCLPFAQLHSLHLGGVLPYNCTDRPLFVL